MATVKPRLQITLEPTTYAAITRLAAAIGASRASVVSDLMRQAEEPLNKTAHLVELAKRAREELNDGTRRVIAGAAAELEQHERQVAELMDFLGKQLGLPLDDTGPSRASGGAGADSDPRPVTRGSGSNPPPPELLHQIPETPVTMRPEHK